MRKRLICAGLVLIAFGITLSACAAKYGRATSDTTAALRITFLEGTALLDCELACSGRWGANRREMKQLHDRQAWWALADRVLTIAYNEDLAWYYLGRSAEGLGYVEAARTYYVKGLSSKKCGGLLNVCDGFVFPLLLNARLAELRSKTGTSPNAMGGDASPAAPTPSVASVPAPMISAPPRLDSTGSGFVVSRSGHILTNEHVVTDCREISVQAPGGPTTQARLVARDQGNDLALLQISLPTPDIAPFRAGDALRAGEGVVVYGFPLAGQLASTGNITVGYITALVGLRDDTRMVQISAPVQPGNSGGPVLDMAGNVVGVVTSKLNVLRVAKVTGDIPQNVNFALRGTLVHAFLEANSVQYESSKLGPRLDPADIGEKARGFTVQIGCYR